MKTLVLGIIIIVASTSMVFAHPGNTASDGCHYCRTNCDEWGVPWNARHCHGTSAPKTYSPPKYNEPQLNYQPQVQPTYKVAQTSSNSDDSAVWSSVAVIGGLGLLAYLFRNKKK